MDPVTSVRKKKCLGDLVSFSDTICDISCLLPNYCPHLQLFVCFCVFSAFPISVCPFSPPLPPTSHFPLPAPTYSNCKCI